MNEQAVTTWPIECFEKIRQSQMKSLQPYNHSFRVLCFALYRLCFEIQNSGKASAHFKMFGHVQGAQFQLEMGGWYSGCEVISFDFFQIQCIDQAQSETRALHVKLLELEILPAEIIETLFAEIKQLYKYEI